MFFDNNFRLIVSKELSAKNNTYIDKALFKAFHSDSLAILRLYSWENSISFGVGQNPCAYEALIKEYSYNYAKRITGGGVLFHGNDISYSLVLPAKFLENKGVKETYEFLCQFLLLFYTNLGLEASFAKDTKGIFLSKNPFCQVGFEAYDIIIKGKKIGGNAQKRSKNVIFQHGSIPLKSLGKDEKYGASLEEFGIKLSFEEALKKLKEAFETTFKAKLFESGLNEEEKLLYENLVKEDK